LINSIDPKRRSSVQDLLNKLHKGGLIPKFHTGSAMTSAIDPEGDIFKDYSSTFDIYGDNPTYHQAPKKYNFAFDPQIPAQFSRLGYAQNLNKQIYEDNLLNYDVAYKTPVFHHKSVYGDELVKQRLNSNFNDAFARYS
jgi:hypothetical protein